MLIQIEENIINGAIGGEEKCINFLRLMAHCAEVGKHVVYVPCLKKRQKIYMDLSRVLTNVEVGLLSYVSAKYSMDFSTIYDNVNIYAIISADDVFSDIIDGDKNVIKINLRNINRFEAFEETHLITENLLDAEFYKYLCFYFQRKNILADCNVVYFSVDGGGSTIGEVYQYEINLQNHFCLAIVDGDKIYPRDVIKPSSTAGKLKKIHTDNCDKQPFYCSHYILEDVSEIENLIPFKLLESYFIKKGFWDFKKEFLPFYDLKYGLTYMKLFDENATRYWKHFFDDKIFKFRDSAKSCYGNQKKYCETIRGCEPIKPGLGEKLLKNILGTKSNQDVLNRISEGDLCEEQKKVWEELGQLIFSWTCAVKPKERY